MEVAGVGDHAIGANLTKEDVDGFLVGGASLKGPDFLVIANAFETQAVSA